MESVGSHPHHHNRLLLPAHLTGVRAMQGNRNLIMDHHPHPPTPTHTYQPLRIIASAQPQPQKQTEAEMRHDIIITTIIINHHRRQRTSQQTSSGLRNEASGRGRSCIATPGRHAGNRNCHGARALIASQIIAQLHPPSKGAVLARRDASLTCDRVELRCWARCCVREDAFEQPYEH